MTPVPYDILDGMIQCFGKCFFYKDSVASFFSAAGVPQSLIDRDRGEAKFVWARRVLTTLGQTEEGCLIQRKLLTSLCNLRKLPDADSISCDIAQASLRKLKQLALDRDFITKKAKADDAQRRQMAQERERVIQQRAEKLESLRRTFNVGLVAPDRQRAGYSLEDLLVELFALFELEYRKSYRTSTQQIDGAFALDGFHYLVEAKWRKDMPVEQEIGGFRQKVESKLESTRGLFVSIQGYRPEVIAQFNGRGANVILIDGSHLIHVLEGRMDLRDLLRRLVDRAAQEGIVYTAPLSL